MTCELVNAININDSTIFSGILNQTINSYLFTVVENENITININFQVNNTTPYVKLLLYAVEGETLVEVGNSFLIEFNNVINYDAQVGEYLLCLENLYPAGLFVTNYDVSLIHTEYDGIILTNILGYCGQLSTFEFAPYIPQPCNSEVQFELLYGDLPKGLTFENNGIIKGIPPEQDCIKYNNDLLPSFTWYDINKNGESQPNGNEYLIMVRISLVDYPDVFDDKEFRICINNNWSADKEIIIKQLENSDKFELECK